MTAGCRALLRDLCDMARTGRHSFTGRPVGAALAARLPRLIACARRLAGADAAGERGRP